jgi:hypothetical protein
MPIYGLPVYRELAKCAAIRPSEAVHSIDAARRRRSCLWVRIVDFAELLTC